MVDSLEELRKAIASGNALLVCGAGVSTALTGGKAPGWKALIDAAFEAAKSEAKAKSRDAWVTSCKALLRSRNVNDWLRAADHIQDKLGGSSGPAWKQFLRGQFARLTVVEPALADAIRALGSPVATTNYDGCLYLNLGRAAVTWRDHGGVA